MQALSVGIFPYVLKLLQSSARELRPLLVFIWSKLLAVDSVRVDLTVSVIIVYLSVVLFSYVLFYVKYPSISFTKGFSRMQKVVPISTLCV